MLIQSALKYKSLIKDFIFLYGLVILQRLLGLISTYFLVRVLSETQFAEYNLIIGYISLFAVFSLPELGNAVMQSTARQESKLYFRAQKLMFVAAILAGLLMLAFSFLHKNNDEYSATLFAGLICAALFFPFYQGLTLWQAYRLGLKKIKNLSLLNGLSSVFTYSVVIALLVWGNINDYMSILIAYLLIPSVINLIMIAIDYVSNIKEESKDIANGMIKYGIKTSLYSGIHVLAIRLDSFILFYLISPESMAVFTVANKVPEMLRGLTQTVSATLAPRLAKQNYITNKLKKAISLYSISFAILVILTTFTIYPYFMDFLFGDKYNQAILYSQVIMCSLVIGNFANINFGFIRSQKDAQNYKKITLVISIVRIISVLAFVPLFGIWGAVFSILFYRISMMIIVQFIIKKDYSNPKSNSNKEK